jgi:hypothetical protein
MAKVVVALSWSTGRKKEDEETKEVKKQPAPDMKHRQEG